MSVDRSLQIQWAKAGLREEYRHSSPEQRLLIRGWIGRYRRLFDGIPTGTPLGDAARIKAARGDSLALEFLSAVQSA